MGADLQARPNEPAQTDSVYEVPPSRQGASYSVAALETGSRRRSSWRSLRPRKPSAADPATVAQPLARPPQSAAAALSRRGRAIGEQPDHRRSAARQQQPAPAAAQRGVADDSPRPDNAPPRPARNRCDSRREPGPPARPAPLGHPPTAAGVGPMRGSRVTRPPSDTRRPSRRRTAAGRRRGRARGNRAAASARRRDPCRARCRRRRRTARPSRARRPIDEQQIARRARRPSSAPAPAASPSRRRCRRRGPLCAGTRFRASPAAPSSGPRPIASAYGRGGAPHQVASRRSARPASVQRSVERTVARLRSTSVSCSAID